MNENLIYTTLRMLQDRAEYWKAHGDSGALLAYSSAAAMLEYAIAGDNDSLAQFDYYCD